MTTSARMCGKSSVTKKAGKPRSHLPNPRRWTRSAPSSLMISFTARGQADSKVDFMKKIISVRDVREMVRNGQDLKNLPADALVTPSARDLLFELETNGTAKTIAGKNNSGSPAENGRLAPPSRPLNSKSPRSE